MTIAELIAHLSQLPPGTVVLTNNCCHGLELPADTDIALRRVIERPAHGWPTPDYEHTIDDELDDPDHERFVEALVIES